MRCIKPNENKAPHSFDSGKVLLQLRSNGVMETVRYEVCTRVNLSNCKYCRLRKAGYEQKVATDTFFHRYNVRLVIFSLISFNVIYPFLLFVFKPFCRFWASLRQTTSRTFSPTILAFGSKETQRSSSVLYLYAIYLVFYLIFCRYFVDPETRGRATNAPEKLRGYRPTLRAAV